MKKFLAWLEAHGACPERVRHFAFFPTLELAAQAATVDDLDWLTQQEPFTAAREIFEAAERQALEIYSAAERQSREIYYAAERQAWEIYDAAVSQAWEIYDAAERPAWEI